MDWNSKYGPWAVVTGASAGLGEHFARQLAKRGENLVLVARREYRLHSLAQELRDEFAVETVSLPLDLSVPGAVEELAQRTAEQDVGLFVDNAGFGYMGRLLDQDPERLAGMIHLNCTVTLLAAVAFAKRMKARGGGGIIVSASLAGFQATPHMAAYGATKGFDLLFAEGLAHELRGAGVDVLALCPGSTSTEFGQVAGSKGGTRGSMKPGPVVAEALRALGRKDVVVTGLANKVVGHVLGPILPRRWVTAASAVAIKRMVKDGRDEGIR
jgi:short-subunit dehydrogenase